MHTRFDSEVEKPRRLHVVGSHRGHGDHGDRSVSVYRLHSQSLSMTMASRFYIQAPQLAQQKLAELEAASLDDLVQDSGDFGENFPGYTWQAAVEDVESELLGEISRDLKRIDVTVAYHENEFTYQVRIYRFAR